VLLFMPIEFKLTKLDLSFDISCPVFSFLFTVKMIANGGIAFDTDDRTPMGSSVFIFTFGYTCLCSNLFLL